MAQIYEREMREETMARSPSASIVFVSVAVICLATGLYAPAFKTLMTVFLLLLVPLNNLIRTIPYMHWKTHGHIGERMWMFFCLGAVKNGFIWGAVIALGISSTPDSQWATTFYLLIAIAFSNSSIFTLGLNRPVHLWFIASLNLPPIIYLLYVAHTNEDRVLISIAGTLAVSALYTVVQGKIYRTRFLEKINSERALLKSQQELLEQRAMTEHANRLTSLGEVSAGVAHEINNPLSIVTGSLNLLETQLKNNSQLNDQHATYIQRSFNALDRIQKIVRAMSILSLRSSSPTRLEETPTAIIEQALSIFNEKIYQGRIIIKRDLRSEELLNCDPTQLTQIVVNLLNNAIDAVQSIGRDADRWILIETETINNRMVLSVSNGGAGITPPVAAKLFTPFFTTKPVGQGTGLGLSISRSIALQHQGDLYFDPRGDITRFRLTLPLSAMNNQSLSGIS